MPFLRIRHLGLRVVTAEGLFGVNIPFEDGLNILRAENTAGKSTSMMSILYGLGLEGMLGPTQNPPLPAAMRERLQYQGRLINVLESQVLVEIQNLNFDFITVSRKVTGTPRDRQLIRVYEGREATEPRPLRRSSDFYVRAARSAQADLGFHTFLSRFMGLDLPWIPKSDGSPTPLYLECLFPYFFVEQLTGWRDIKARMPTHLQIPEMSKRTAEFVLNLEVLKASVRLQELQQESKRIADDWQDLRKRPIAVVGFGVIVRGIPETPVLSWPPESKPRLHVTDGGTWEEVESLIIRDSEHLERLVSEELPRAESISAKASQLLRELEGEYGAIEKRYNQIQSEIRIDQSQYAGVYERLQYLKEDRQKYQDEKRLRARGGLVSDRLPENKCPVCDRPLNSDMLLSPSSQINPMSIEENIEFINDQISTFEFMLEDVTRVLRVKEQRSTALVERMRDVSSRTQALKETLRSHGQLPSATAIKDRLRLEDRLVRLNQIKSEFASRIDSFNKLIDRYRIVQDELITLKQSKLSANDNRKLGKLETFFIEQLNDYLFTSYPLDDVGIGRESYRPSQNEYDLGFTSASDTIRTIWAYLLGMLEVARSERTNHIGFLLFDEPRQQSARELSFKALLLRASSAKSFGQQVIFATSQDEKSLLEMIDNLPVNYMPYPEKMIMPL